MHVQFVHRLAVDGRPVLRPAYMRQVLEHEVPHDHLAGSHHCAARRLPLLVVVVVAVWRRRPALRDTMQLVRVTQRGEGGAFRAV